MIEKNKIYTTSYYIIIVVSVFNAERVLQHNVVLRLQRSVKFYRLKINSVLFSFQIGRYDYTVCIYVFIYILVGVHGQPSGRVGQKKFENSDV